jgi:hypothetical protein
VGGEGEGEGGAGGCAISCNWWRLHRHIVSTRSEISVFHAHINVTCLPSLSFVFDRLHPLASIFEELLPSLALHFVRITQVLIVCVLLCRLVLASLDQNCLRGFDHTLCCGSLITTAGTPRLSSSPAEQP